MARYKDAVEWAALNDDNDWLVDPDGHISVCASMVVDLFAKDEATVQADIAAALAREERRERLSERSRR